jgi:SAM-dependent methyltransferase
MSLRSEQPLPAPGSSFGEIAATLRRELLEHAALEPAGALDRASVETNSGLVERRGRPIAAIACERLGAASLVGTRLLDLGCGYGGLAALFAFEGARVTAVDSNAGRLQTVARVAARHSLDVSPLRGRMERLGFADGSFDVAVMNNSFVYLVDSELRRRALAEALRVLTPGGVLVMRNANRLHPVDQFTGLPLIHLLPPATAVRAATLLGRRRSLCRPRSPGATRRELDAAGFADTAHHATSDRLARAPKTVGRYTHLSALRPARLSREPARAA